MPRMRFSAATFCVRIQRGPLELASDMPRAYHGGRDDRNEAPGRVCSDEG